MNSILLGVRHQTTAQRTLPFARDSGGCPDMGGGQVKQHVAAT